MIHLHKYSLVTCLDWDELSDIQIELLKQAARARLNAQAPYSHYFVGVAILSGSGKIYRGCNVERCSWTQTTHAEQNAIDAMVAEEGPSKIIKLGLVAAPDNVQITLPPHRDGSHITPDQVPVPCGHCLQCIWENCFNDKNVELLALCPNGQIAITTIDSAFPFKFGPADLGVNYSNKFIK